MSATSSSARRRPASISGQRLPRSEDATRSGKSTRQGSRPATTKPVGSGRTQTKDTLKAKEEEYRRLNAELEAKTSELVKEAEELLLGNLSILSDVEPTSPRAQDGDGSPLNRSTTDHTKAILPKKSTATGTVNKKQRNNIQRPITSSGPVPGSKQTSRQPSRRPQTVGVSGGKLSPRAAIAQVKPISVDIENTVQRLEKALVESGGGTSHQGGEVIYGQSYHGDDILPETAQDMGSEATIRFLKAKLRVMQEEMDRLCQENNEKEKQLSTYNSKLKELTDQTSKLQRNYQTASAQVEKYKQSAESLRLKCDGLESQLVSLRKDMDSMKGDQRKASTQHSAVEVRLNRALEEVDKYKTALQKARSESKDVSKHERQCIEELNKENKRLEKQKSELMAAFKKQMKLIDILKRQKMHIEAAKMLSFTEEEFVKALDWGAS